MSTFSTKGGLYERAQKRFNVSNGKRLFTYSFYEKRKLEALVRIRLIQCVYSLYICITSGPLHSGSASPQTHLEQTHHGRVMCYDICLVMVLLTPSCVDNPYLS